MRPDSWSTSYLFRWPFGISMVTSNSTASFSLRSGDLGSPQCGAWMHRGTKEVRVRRVLLASATVLLLLTGYAVADVVDLAPGVLTRDRPAAAPAPTVSSTPALVGASGDPALKGGLGVSVRDGITGEEIWALDADRARVPASTVKLLSALAVADGLDLRDTMTTEVAAVPGSTEVVLVASGDTLLAPGRGNAGQVAGRAGLADPARQGPDALPGSGPPTGAL